MNRKSNLAIMCALATLTLTAACGGSGGGDDDSATGDIHLIIPSNPGGGNDTTARWMSKLITEFDDAHPSVELENVSGGSGIAGINKFANSLDHDGSNYAMVSPSALGQWLLGSEDADFDIADFRLIAGVGQGYITYVSPDLDISDAADFVETAKSGDVVVGLPSATGSSALLLLGLEVLQVTDDVKAVFGYDGAGGTTVAFQQGEIDMTHGSGAAYVSEVKPLLDSGDAVPLWATGVIDADGNLVRDPTVPDLPTLEEYYVAAYGSEPSGEAWDAYLTYLKLTAYNVLATHNDAPAKPVDALIATLTKASEDADVQAEMGTIVGEYPIWIGDEWKDVQEAAASIDPDTRKWLQDFLTEKYDVTGIGS